MSCCVPQDNSRNICNIPYSELPALWYLIIYYVHFILNSGVCLSFTQQCSTPKLASHSVSANHRRLNPDFSLLCFWPLKSHYLLPLAYQIQPLSTYFLNCSPPRSAENLEMLLSVCPSVRLSVCPSVLPSVTHLFALIRFKNHFLRNVKSDRHKIFTIVCIFFDSTIR